jgi:hypothetical protein
MVTVSSFRNTSFLGGLLFVGSAISGIVAFLANLSQISSALPGHSIHLAGTNLLLTLVMGISFLGLIIWSCALSIYRNLKEKGIYGIGRRCLLKTPDQYILLAVISGACPRCGGEMETRFDKSSLRVMAFCKQYPAAHEPYWVDASSFFRES